VTTRQPKVHTQLGRAAVQIFAARIFLVDDRMNQMLIEHLDPAAWTAKPTAKPPGKNKVRTIAAIFTPMHNVRCRGKRGHTGPSPFFPNPIKLEVLSLTCPATGSPPRRLHIRPREVSTFE